jgi:serine/threonine protein kinase
MDDAPTIDAGELPNAVNAFSPQQRVLNRFEMIRLLGRGGMGVVWLARDLQLERDVALKFLPASVQSDPEAIADLKRETRRALELTHPNIVRIHDFLPDGQSACICMEYIDGETLAARKAARGCLNVDDVLPWLGQLCDALRYAHEVARVIHRDLKPANLMLGSGGQLKITDFGIASSVADSVSRLSMRKLTSGTPAYASPQQMNGEPPSPLDDIYAVGATLYDLLSGKPPFFRGDVAHQARTVTAPPISGRRQELNLSGLEIPPVWETTIAACLAKNPAERPQSIGELQRLLTQPIAPTPVASSPPGKAHSRATPTLALVSVFVLIGAAAWWLYSNGTFRGNGNVPLQATPTPRPPTASELLAEARRLRALDAPQLARDRLLAALALEPQNRAVLDELTALGAVFSATPSPTRVAPAPPAPPARPEASIALIANIRASSTLDSQVSEDGRRNSYGAKNAIDGDLATAWAAAREASDVSLEISFRQEVNVKQFTIFPGYGKDAETFMKNNRVQEFSLTFPNGHVQRFRCEDRRERQTFTLAAPEACTALTFRVLSVYSATRFKGDTPISEISF